MLQGAASEPLMKQGWALRQYTPFSNVQAACTVLLEPGVTSVMSAGLEDYKPPANAFMLHGWTLNGFSAGTSSGHASDGHLSNGGSPHPSGHSVPLTHSVSIPQTGAMAIPQRPLPPLPPSMLSLNGHSPGTQDSPQDHCLLCFLHADAVWNVAGRIVAFAVHL